MKCRNNFKIRALRKLWQPVAELFSPAVCVCCRQKLLENEEMICTECRWEIPLTYFWNIRENPVYDLFYNTVVLENASAFFLYNKGSRFREMIHHLKYHGQKKIGYNLGLWYGRELKESGRYDGIDLIVPVPVHRSRYRQRGYNQSDHIAEGLAQSLGVGTDRTSVVRKVKTDSQSQKKSKKERMSNVEGIFDVRDPATLCGKHILLVDDVVTTGSTLESCAGTIRRQVEGCRISIAALAFSKGG